MKNEWNKQLERNRNIKENEYTTQAQNGVSELLIFAASLTKTLAATMLTMNAMPCDTALRISSNT
jgi:hypothetical protein